jgi:hypothetical protein
MLSTVNLNCGRSFVACGHDPQLPPRRAEVKAGVDPYAYEGLEDGDDDCPWTEPQESKVLAAVVVSDLYVLVWPTRSPRPSRGHGPGHGCALLNLSVMMRTDWTRMCLCALAGQDLACGAHV